MMKTFIFFLVLSTAASNIPAYAQAALPFLLRQQSPLFIGAGETGTALPMNDPIGFYYNPSQLGYYSRGNSLSVFFMPDQTSLNNLYWPDITSGTYGFTFGYNFNSNGGGIPLSIGAGFMRNKITYDYFFMANSGNSYYTSSYQDLDSFDCFSLGASYNFYLLFNLGFSVKSFRSELSSMPVAGYESGLKTSGTAFDIGAMIIAPLDELLLKETQIKIGGAFFKPKLKASAGYSVSNLGKKFYFVDPAQSNPLPRTERLGYSLNLGFSSKIYGAELPVFEYSFTAETEDLLVSGDTLGNFSYQGLLANIQIGNNLLLLNGGPDIMLHKGHVFNFLNTLILVTGSVTGEHLFGTKTSGWAVSTEGLFTVLEKNVQNPAFLFIFRHFDLKFYRSEISAGPYFTQKPSGMALYFNQIML